MKATNRHGLVDDPYVAASGFTVSGSLRFGQQGLTTEDRRVYEEKIMMKTPIERIHAKLCTFCNAAPTWVDHPSLSEYRAGARDRLLCVEHLNMCYPTVRAMSGKHIHRYKTKQVECNCEFVHPDAQRLEGVSL